MSSIERANIQGVVQSILEGVLATTLNRCDHHLQYSCGRSNHRPIQEKDSIWYGVQNFQPI